MRHHEAFIALLGLIALLHSSDAKRRLKRPGAIKVQPAPDTSAFVDNELDLKLNEIESIDDLNEGNINVQQIDPCKKRHCSAGQICKLTEDGDPICVCIPECPKESDPRRKVCSNKNETWGSDCELNQMRCWCEGDDPRCRNPELAHQHVDYFGECKEMQECTNDQMLDFPRRMRDWLFHIMRDMADREELSPYYQKLERIAESNYTRRWSIAAVWKWCDLELGNDRAVSRHELFPIRAPLVAMEHCIAPFLDSCAKDDHKITLDEWLNCLELDKEEIEEKCGDIRDANEF